MYFMTFANGTDKPPDYSRDMNLGNVNQSINLAAPFEKYPTGSIEVDQNGNPVAIYWRYKKKVTKQPLEAGSQNLVGFAEDYFTTVAGSGLAAPTIVSVKKEGSANEISVLKTENSYEENGTVLMSGVKSKLDVSNLSAGTYEFIVKTPIREHRRYYVLDVNARLSGNFNAGQRVSVNGDYRTLDKNETIVSDGSVRGILDTKDYKEFKYYDDYLHPNDDIDTNGTYHVGDYLNENELLWYASTVNKYQAEDVKTLNTALDTTQENREQNVYVFSPSQNGYEKTKSVTSNDNLISENLKASNILLVRKKAAVRAGDENAKTNHSFGEKATIEAFKGNIHIEREWESGVSEDKKTDSKFEIYLKETSNDKRLVTILKNQTETDNTGGLVNRFEEETASSFVPSRGRFKYKNWEVKQVDLPKDTYVTTMMSDLKKLNYFFKDAVLKENTQNKMPENQVCERYGVIAIGTDAGTVDENEVHNVNPEIKMNQYEYYRDPNNPNNTGPGQFFQGGSLYGKFRIPANAQAGDKFTFQLPQEMIYNGQVYNEAGYIGDVSATLGGVTKKIGRMYISHSSTTIFNKDGNGYWDKRYSTVTFKLNANANWPHSYEGNFFMGDELRGWDKYGNQKPTYRIKTINNYPIPEEQLSKFIVKQGFVVGPDLVDVSAPFAPQVVNKQVKVETEYFDSGGHVNDACQRDAPPVMTNIKGYFTNPYINKQNGLMRKFVINEGIDRETGKPFITYRLIFNGGILGGGLEVSPKMYFFDYMPEGVELLHGNNQEGINKSVKVWVSGFGNIAGTTNNGDPYLNEDATAFPRGSEASSTVDVRITDIGRNYLYDSLNITDQITDNDNQFVPMGHKLSFEVWNAAPYNNNNNNNARGYVVVADVKMLRGKSFAGQFINLMSSQQAERSESPSKVRVLYYSPGYAGGSGVSEIDTASFSFKKKIEDGNTVRVPNENEVFTFHLKKDGDPNFSMTRKNNGELVQFGELENGTYRLTEEYSKVGYGMNPSEIEIKVNNGKVTFNGQAYDKANLPEVVNKKKPVLKIIKRDKDTHALLNGYRISIQRLNAVGGEVGEKLQYGSMSDEDPGAVEIIPNEDGIPFGKYLLVEEKAPKGYSKEMVDYGYGDGPEEKVYYLEVNQNGIYLNDSGSFIGAYNKPLTKDATGDYVLLIDNKKNPPPQKPPVKTELTLLKRDGKTQVPLSGAEFTVYTNEAATNVDTSVNGFFTGTNDEGKLTLTNLTSNKTYYLKETKVPESYNQNARNTVYKIVVDEDGQITVSRGTEVLYRTGYDKVLKIDNEKTSAYFNIFKYVTIAGDEFPKEGAVFTLYTDEQATTPAQIAGNNIEATSKIDGVATFNNLPLSTTYYLKETKAPENAIKSDKVYKVAIDDVGKVSIYEMPTNTLVDNANAKDNGSQNVRLRVENQTVEKTTMKIYLKKADKTEVRNRVNQIRYGNVANYEDVNIMHTSAFYPEYAVEDLYGYEAAGITKNIKSLDATFEILKGDKTSFNPRKIVSTNLTQKWGQDPVLRMESGYETGNDYAEVELPDGDYFVREIQPPNGYPDTNKTKDIQVKLSRKSGQLSFVNVNTGAAISNNDTVGSPDMDGIYDGYYIFGYNFPENFASLPPMDKQGIAINGTVNTLLITNEPGSDVHIEKRNEDNEPLKGARFKIDDGTENSGTASDSSKFDFSKISSGYHTLTETQAPFLISPLKESVTFYKTDFGKIIIPAKKLTEDEQKEVDRQSTEIRNKNAQTLKDAYENYIWVKDNLLDEEETKNAKESYYRKIIEVEDEIAKLYEDNTEKAREVKNLISVDYEKDEDGKIRLDENGNVFKATIIVKNMSIPVTKLFVNNLPYILIAIGGFLVVTFIFLKIAKKRRNDI